MLIDAAIRQVVGLAQAEWSPLQYEGEFPVSGFGISEIRPYHIENTTSNIPQYSNLNYWQTSVVTTSSWATWIDVTMDRDQYVIVEGLFFLDADPVVTEIAVTANGVDLPVINIEQSYALDTGRIWFTKPFFVKPNNQLKIQLYGRQGITSNSSVRIGLLGHTIAKRPRLITAS